MPNSFDVFIDWALEKIVLRSVAIATLAFTVGGIGYGIYYSFEYFHEKISPMPIEKVSTEFHPYYWSCTAVTWQEYQGGNIKTGHYTGHKCLCSKWEARMVGKDHPADAQCPDGSRAEELNGIR